MRLARNLAVRARAGTGKTSSICDMAKAIPASVRAIAVTFNKLNAVDLEPKVPRHVDVKTLHALGFAALKRAWGPNLRTDSERQRKLAREVVPEPRRHEYNHRSVVSAVSKLVSLAMNCLATTREALTEIMYEYDVLAPAGVTAEEVLVWAEAVLLASREKTIEPSFDDMIYLPAIENLRTGNYDVVFFDEAQDANPAQERLILNAVKKRGGKVVIVGDDRQAIYKFRGAGAGAYDGLVATLDAEVLPLTVTWRCPARVVELAKTLVPDYEAAPGVNKGRVTWETEEGLYKGVVPGDVVISRTNAGCTKTCTRLLRRGVRATIVGREIGEQLKSLVEKSGATSIPGLVTWLNRYVERESEKLLALDKDDKAEELADIADSIKEIAEGLRDLSELRFKLDTLFVDKLDNAFVSIRTVHKSKGLEWPRVWMLEGTHSLKSVEAENLYYVSVTRVKTGKEGPGELRLVQTARKDGRIPPSIAEELLGPEVIERWAQEDEEGGEEGEGED